MNDDEQQTSHETSTTPSSSYTLPPPVNEKHPPIYQYILAILLGCIIGSGGLSLAYYAKYHELPFANPPAKQVAAVTQAPDPADGKVEAKEKRSGILKEGKTEVTQEDLNNLVTAGKDCTKIAEFSSLSQGIDKGELTLIDLNAGSLEVKYAGYVTSYPRWKSTSLPTVVDRNCSKISFTELKAGEYISVYGGREEGYQQDTRLIQKL